MNGNLSQLSAIDRRNIFFFLYWSVFSSTVVHNTFSKEKAKPN